MARYKTSDTGPRFLAVDLKRQLVAGTFEHALDWLIDHELDLRSFDARYRNDANGAHYCVKEVLRQRKALCVTLTKSNIKMCSHRVTNEALALFTIEKRVFLQLQRSTYST